MDNQEYRESKIDVELEDQVSFYTMQRIRFKTLPFKEGECRLIFYYPENLEYKEGNIYPVYFNFHGGGFTLTLAENDDLYCRYIAHNTECIVINVDYAVAPENKFPEGIESSYRAVKWVYHHSKSLFIDRMHMAVGGQSAGGNIAAVLTLLSVIRKEFYFNFQMIAYGLLDLHEPIEEKNKNMAAGLPQSLTVNRMHQYMSWYFNDYQQDSLDFRASPLRYADLAGLPPALIVSAEYDQLKFEQEAYSIKLKEAGVPVSYDLYTSCGHGFSHDNPQFSRKFWDSVVDSIKKFI